MATASEPSYRRTNCIIVKTVCYNYHKQIWPPTSWLGSIPHQCLWFRKTTFPTNPSAVSIFFSVSCQNRNQCHKCLKVHALMDTDKHMVERATILGYSKLHLCTWDSNKSQHIRWQRNPKNASLWFFWKSWTAEQIQRFRRREAEQHLPL